MIRPVVHGELQPVLRHGRVCRFEVEVVCPYCGDRHVHGAGEFGEADGPRRPHCRSGAFRPAYVVKVPQEVRLWARELVRAQAVQSTAPVA